jgi:hypothetical protein
VKKSARIDKLKDNYQKLLKEYNKLPRKSSFSGWEILDKIEKVKEQIEKLE